MKSAKCNLDGRPINPHDQTQIDRFKQFLLMTDEERRNAVKNDPEWRKWLGIKEN